MRKLLILAAAAALSAACHNRSEDEVGAAPDQGRTTVSPDSVGLDSTAAQAADTSAVG